MENAAHKEFISVEEARALVIKNTGVLRAGRIPLEKAAFYILARNVKSPLRLPRFDNSAMDGFAVRAKELASASKVNTVTLRVAGIIRAGDSAKKILEPNTTLRIMTGAPLPKGADAVVMQEMCKRVDDGKACFTENVKQGENVRYAGEEIKKSETALRAGTLLTPASIGFLSSCGVDNVVVRRKPRVSVLITGNEVIFSGIPRGGQIRDANGAALASALQKNGIQTHILHKKDSFREIYSALKKLLSGNDMVLICGGVSVGEYDFVKDALEKLHVRKIFWKVRQKPGKPLFFGKKGETLVFGLPGNPYAVLCCFYEYVLPSLLKMMGHKNLFLMEKQCILENNAQKKKELCVFLKGNVNEKNGETYAFLEKGQGSHMLKSLATANALIVLPEGRSEFRSGETITAHLLP